MAFLLTQIQSVWTLVGRKETKLSRPEWKPSITSPRYMEELLSYMGMRLAALLSRLDGANNAAKPATITSISTVADLLNRVSTLEQELTNWYHDYAANLGCTLPLYWPEQSFHEPEIAETAGFRFLSLDVAHQGKHAYTAFQLC